MKFKGLVVVDGQGYILSPEALKQLVDANGEKFSREALGRFTSTAVGKSPTIEVLRKIGGSCAEKAELDDNGQLFTEVVDLDVENIVKMDDGTIVLRNCGVVSNETNSD